MKSLLIVRHAKSSWDDINLSDFERPLNSRGKRDAPLMANLAKTLDLIPQIIYTSPAVRALTTAQVFQEMFNNSIPLIENKEIYHASELVLEDIIKDFDNQYNYIALFGHNPGLSFLIEKLTNRKIWDVPTCGMVNFKFNCNEWSKVLDCINNFSHYFPKDGLD